VVEPLLSFTDVLDAPVSGCVSGFEEFDPPALVEPLAPPALVRELELPAPPLPSICESRFCRALDRLFDVGAVDPVDDWLCAASSALIVAGDSCDNPFVPEAAAELAEAEALSERANGLVWLESVDGAEDFGDISDWRASTADDAAPNANSTTELRQMPHRAAGKLSRRLISKRRATAKCSVKRGLFAPPMARRPRQ
jgi:hypothetical protein